MIPFRLPRLHWQPRSRFGRGVCRVWRKAPWWQWFLAGFLLLVNVVGGANLWMVRTTDAYIFREVEKLPDYPVALLLGTSPWYRSGEPNLHFKYRMEAAAALYHMGKVKHILVSGANPDKTYNEPRAMRRALVKLGVPETAMTLDFAGLRTLDSVLRAREVFGQNKILIISQRYHAYRALFIAQQNGMQAVAYAADNPPLGALLYIEPREILARLGAMVDVWILRRKPHFLGEPVYLPMQAKVL